MSGAGASCGASLNCSRHRRRRCSTGRRAIRGSASCSARRGAGCTIEDEKIVAETADGDFAFDHLLLGTGYETDLTCRPELAGVVEHIALWRDRYTPPPGEEDAALGRYPYLGRAFEFLERVPGTAPWVGRIHVFNNGAVPSLGPVCNGVTGLKYGAPKIAAGIGRSLFSKMPTGTSTG